ncbi:RNA polymerase sigma factor [Streptomyces sp. NPDC090112]|uniref:RNA polymerase sigma factor n=1 Tax=Streptomyces sp. NPDC090112 TaxID=3365949 RepID=UPI003815E52F
MPVPPEGSITSEAEGRSDVPPASLARFEEFARQSYQQVPAKLRARFPSLSRHMAEEVTAEAIVRVYERWIRIDGMANPDAYLMTVARNLLIDNLRHQRRVSTVDDLALAQIPAQPANPTAESELLGTVIASIEGMRMGQRREVVQLQSRGLADAEIAAVLGISMNQVHVQRHRAISELRKQLHRLIRGSRRR